MSQFNPASARSWRIRAGKRLVDIAVSADCAPATVRSFEYGAPVRASILARLQAAYDQICGAETKTAKIAGEVQR